MDKLQMAQDYILAEVGRVGICSIDQDKIMDAWKVADAMQAEADKRESKERPDVLKEEWQPDWSQIPHSDVVSWEMMTKDQARWNALDGGYYLAPSFDYQGNWKESLRKRPEVLCELDWSVAPEEANVYFKDGDNEPPKWFDRNNKLIGTAPDFGFSGYVCEYRPQ